MRRVIWMWLLRRLWNLCTCSHVYADVCDFAIVRKLEQSVDVRFYVILELSATVILSMLRQAFGKMQLVVRKCLCLAGTSRGKIKLSVVSIRFVLCIENLLKSNVLQRILKSLREVIRRKRPYIWNSQHWIPYDDNAPGVRALLTHEVLPKTDMTSLLQSPNSSVLAPVIFQPI